MKTDKLVRAWKDVDFRSGLSREELDGLRENPAGAVDLSDEVLQHISGGGDSDACSNNSCGSDGCKLF